MPLMHKTYIPRPNDVFQDSFRGDILEISMKRFNYICTLGKMVGNNLLSSDSTYISFFITNRIWGCGVRSI